MKEAVDFLIIKKNIQTCNTFIKYYINVTCLLSFFKALGSYFLILNPNMHSLISSFLAAVEIFPCVDFKAS